MFPLIVLVILLISVAFIVWVRLTDTGNRNIIRVWMVFNFTMITIGVAVLYYYG